MGRSYSLDLRRRVVARVAGGQSRRGAAEDFEVSPSFSVKLVARHRRTGSLAPQRQGRPPGTGKLAPYGDFLIARVQAKPDMTMPELAAELAARHGVAASPASLSRFLCKAGFSYKKNPAGHGTRTLRRRQGARHLEA
jgi:transposase